MAFYLAAYPDLRTAFGANYEAALEHWVSQGLPKEGRRGSREFDVAFYLAAYPDLRTAFGANYEAALEHWVSQGLPKEGRRGSREFDVAFYLAAYPDLRTAFGANYEAALDHWIITGRGERRRGFPADVSPALSLFSHPGLARAAQTSERTFRLRFPSFSHDAGLGTSICGECQELRCKKAHPLKEAQALLVASDQEQRIRAPLLDSRVLEKSRNAQSFSHQSTEGVLMPQYRCKVVSAGPDKNGGVIIGLKDLATHLPAWPDRQVFLANENVRRQILATALTALNMSTGRVVVTLENLDPWSPCDSMGSSSLKGQHKLPSPEAVSRNRA